MPAGVVPQRKFFPIPVGGTWKEAMSPFGVGNTGGLTACSNLIYRRYGSWGWRPGSKTSYTTDSQSALSTPVSGIRWYRSLPTPQTTTVVVGNNAVFTGGDVPATLSTSLSLTGQDPTIPVSFAAAYDANNGANGTAINASDILIMAGTQTNFSFATGSFSIYGAIPTSASTLPSIQLNFINGSYTPSTQAYSVLPTDTFASIGQNLVTLIQNMNAITPGAVGLATYDLAYNSSSIPTGVTIHVGAAFSGSAGNAVQISTTTSNLGTLSVTPSSPTNLTGGGQAFSGPIKYDGTTFSGLSWMITNAFTGCVTWHDHVWYWGDPAHPNTLYASDINNPEGFSFMRLVGPYPIGLGDNDEKVQTCVPIGNFLYIFKRNAIYIVSGYDFQAGEYQFQISPYIQGVGTPAPNCVAVLNNALVFWDGARFMRLTPGAQAPEHIGQPINLTCGNISTGNPRLMRAVAGSFNINVDFNNSYTAPEPVAGTGILTNCAYFACDVGNGQADTVLVYDDDATQFLGEYAWAPWSGWVVGGWMTFGGGVTSATSLRDDQPNLFYITGTQGVQISVLRVGGNPHTDNSTPISWMVQTGWVTMGTPALSKNLHRVFLHVEANAGVTIAQSIYVPLNVDQGYAPIPTPTGFQGNPQEADFPVTLGYGSRESYQVLVADVNPRIANSYAFMFTLSNNGAQPFELQNLTADYIENPFRP